MGKFEELVRTRRSIRTFDGKGISDEHLKRIEAYMQDVPNPYGIHVEFKLLHAGQDHLTSKVINGTDLWIGAKVKKVPHAEEAFGYSFEEFVLFCQSLGIGTTIIAGTMDRPAFEKAMQLAADEVMLCVTPIGYPAEKMGVKEKLMRTGISADKRADFDKIFFKDAYGNKLAASEAGACEKALEMLRWAPSAVNKQPWRVVVAGVQVHFYEKHSKGYISELGDLQKIDIGIGIKHFMGEVEEEGLKGSLVIEDPHLETPEDVEYIATFRFTK